jgi:uncharacterized protein (TIGR02996 family)
MPFAKFEPDSDELGFINKIKDDYLDDTSRLVFADFLEERDDPRGPFIRYQVENDVLKRQFKESRRKGHPEHRYAPDYLAKAMELNAKILPLIACYGGQWYGPLWSEAERAGHSFDRGMMRILGSPNSFLRAPQQKAMAWADSVQINHEAGGMLAMEKLFAGNHICCVAFSSWTAMSNDMRLRFLRWLHRKKNRLPSRVVAIELGYSVTQEVLNLVATLPDHVLDQLGYIQAVAEWNNDSGGLACADALASRDWSGEFNYTG